jgi:hypothetical protein
MSALNHEQWSEISSALEGRITDLQNGILDADDPEAAERWVKEIEEILDIIGPDGINMCEPEETDEQSTRRQIREQVDASIDNSGEMPHRLSGWKY